MKPFITRTGPKLSYIALGLGVAAAAATLLFGFFASEPTDGDSNTSFFSMLLIAAVVLSIIALCKRAEKPLLPLIGMVAALGGAVGGIVVAVLTDKPQFIGSLRGTAILAGVGFIACLILFLVKWNTVPPAPKPRPVPINRPVPVNSPVPRQSVPRRLSPPKPTRHFLSFLGLILGGAALTFVLINLFCILISVEFGNETAALRAVKNITREQNRELVSRDIAAIIGSLCFFFLMFIQSALGLAALTVSTIGMTLKTKNRMLAVIGCVMGAVTVIASVPMWYYFATMPSVQSIFKAL